MYTFASMISAAQNSADEGLTFSEVLAALPTDPASIAVIGMLLGSVALVVWSGRRSGGKGGKAA